MQVFKVSLKIMKKIFPTLAIYIVIAIVLSIMMAGSHKNRAVDVFNQSKTATLFINNDKEGALTEGLRTYLEKYCNFIEVKETEQSIQDALFFREIDYAIIVPEGFSEQLLEGENPKLEITSVPDAYEAVYIDMAVTNYLKTAELYKKNNPDINQAELVNYLQRDFKTTVQVSLAGENDKSDKSFLTAYFNISMYSLLSVMITGVGALMTIFLDKEIKGRNSVAPISSLRLNIQLMLGNFVFSILVLIGIILTGIIMNKGIGSFIEFCLYIGNVAVFTIVAFSISYLVTMVVKGPNGFSAISTVISLGLSFISGAFVPAELLGENILKVASFTPSYWFIQANEAIGKLGGYSSADLSTIFQYILIELAFAAALIAIALVAGKHRNYETA